jgi:hypothetical protein
MDRRDGEDWSVLGFDGGKIWAGYADITKRLSGNSYDSVYAQFENPSWDRDSNFTAHVSCAGSTNKGTVALRQVGAAWKWMPTPHC